MKQVFQMHLYAKESIDFTGPDFEEVRTIQYRLYFFDKAEFLGSYVGPVTVEAEVPDTFDIRAAMLKDKKAELEKVRAEFTNRITQIQREIAELSALEYVEAQ